MNSRTPMTIILSLVLAFVIWAVSASTTFAAQITQIQGEPVNPQLSTHSNEILKSTSSDEIDKTQNKSSDKQLKSDKTAKAFVVTCNLTCPLGLPGRMVAGRIICLWRIMIMW